jgi:hypothetical protein
MNIIDLTNLLNQLVLLSLFTIFVLPWPHGVIIPRLHGIHPPSRPARHPRLRLKREPLLRKQLVNVVRISDYYANYPGIPTTQEVYDTSDLERRCTASSRRTVNKSVPESREGARAVPDYTNRRQRDDPVVHTCDDALFLLLIRVVCLTSLRTPVYWLPGTKLHTMRRTQPKS